MAEKHSGTSKVYELIPMEQLRKLQNRYPRLRKLHVQAPSEA
jgi:hypothetical protein